MHPSPENRRQSAASENAQKIILKLATYQVIYMWHKYTIIFLFVIAIFSDLVASIIAELTLPELNTSSQPHDGQDHDAFAKVFLQPLLFLLINVFAIFIVLKLEHLDVLSVLLAVMYFFPRYRMANHFPCNELIKRFIQVLAVAMAIELAVYHVHRE